MKRFMFHANSQNPCGVECLTQTPQTFSDNVFKFINAIMIIRSVQNNNGTKFCVVLCVLCATFLTKEQKYITLRVLCVFA